MLPGNRHQGAGESRPTADGGGGQDAHPEGQPGAAGHHHGDEHEQADRGGERAARPAAARGARPPGHARRPRTRDEDAET